MSYQKQVDKPLFEDIFWSRPERADLAGKLMIIGGNRDTLKAPMTAFSSAEDAGVGQAVVYIPDIHKKQLGSQIPGLFYLPTITSGGISKESLNDILGAASNHDMLLLAGDFGKSSETTQLLEELCQKDIGLLSITGDAVDVLLPNYQFFNQQNALLVLNPGQFQKFVSLLGSTTGYKTDMPLEAFSELLVGLKDKIKAKVITLHSSFLWVLDGQTVSATKRVDIQNENTWQVEQTTRSSVFMLQHPNESFESLTSSVFVLDHNQEQA